MSDRIDAELEKLTKLGQTPKVIYVGDDLHLELYGEQNPPYAAYLVDDKTEVPVHPSNEVTEYNGVRVVVLDNVAPDYLRIET